MHACAVLASDTSLQATMSAAAGWNIYTTHTTKNIWIFSTLLLRFAWLHIRFRSAASKVINFFLLIFPISFWDERCIFLGTNIPPLQLEWWASGLPPHHHLFNIFFSNFNRKFDKYVWVISICLRGSDYTYNASIARTPSSFHEYFFLQTDTDTDSNFQFWFFNMLTEREREDGWFFNSIHIATKLDSQKSHPSFSP